MSTGINNFHNGDNGKENTDKSKLSFLFTEVSGGKGGYGSSKKEKLLMNKYKYRNHNFSTRKGNKMCLIPHRGQLSNSTISTRSLGKSVNRYYEENAKAFEELRKEKELQAQNRVVISKGFNKKASHLTFKEIEKVARRRKKTGILVFKKI